MLQRRRTDRIKPRPWRALAVAAFLVISLSTNAGASPLFRSPFRSFDALPPAQYYPIAIADLNHDGLPDVVSAPFGGIQDLYVWLGLPDLRLSDPRYYIIASTGLGSRSLVITDLDGDGISDALVGGDGWGYFPGRGDGSFGPFRNTADHDNIGAVAAADLNGDGIPDIVATSSTDFPHLIVRLGRGGGVMDSASAYRLVGYISRPPTGLAIVDVNGDGLPDALISSYTSYECWILPGTPGGGFGPATLLGNGGLHLFSGDFNRDGHADFVSDRKVFLGRGDGSFYQGPDLGAEVVGIADFGGDGNSDLIVLHDASVEILGGRGDGTFTSRGEFPCGSHPRCVAAADMNGDGRLDLVVSLSPVDGGSPAFSVLIGDGHGGLGALTTVLTGSNPRKVLAADLTGDGLLDLITAERGKRRVAVRPGLGGLRFSGPAEFETAPGLTTAMLADLNGDGLPDLVAVGDTSATVSTFLGIPGGSFGVRRDFPAGGASTALTAGDFNEDGHLDVATSWSLLRGDGAGGLVVVQSSVLGGPGAAVVATDFDNDGHVDLVTLTASWGGYAKLFLGDGAGGFGYASTLGYGFYPHTMAIADLDLNGWKDVVAVMDSSNGNTFLRVDLMGSGGLFGRIGVSATSVGSIPTDVLLADLDGDGNLDAAVACYGVNAVSVLRGHPDGTFSDRVDYGVADGPVSLAAADLNGDGAPELLVACERSNNVAILENLQPSVPTPVLIALIESAAGADGVRLTWQVATRPGLDATVYRRDESGAWEARAVVHADGSGMVRYADPSVVSGQRYAYRLGYDEQSVERFSAEVWITVPQRARLALQGSRPNPALADLSVAFSLPDGSPASLELLDVTGRVLQRREVGALGAGDHVLALGAGLGLRPGIYLIRLVRGPDSRSARAVVIR